MKKTVSILIFLISITLLGKLQYQFKDVVLIKEGDPYMLLTTDMRLDDLKVTLKPEKGKARVFKYHSMVPNKTIKVKFKQKKGVKKYNVSIKGKYTTGETITDSFEFIGVKLFPFGIKIDKKDVDLDNYKAKFSTIRECKKVEIKIYNIKNNLIYENSVKFDNPKKDNIEISWKKLNDEIKQINIVAYDNWGFWAGISVNPFSVHIPHKEVKFDSGKWEVTKNELPKIKDSYKKVKKALKKYGNDISLKLYVAGYTDTVGTKKSNLNLSRERAKSIAKSFKKFGLKIPIYYIGFGESVQKRVTKDEVDEPLNRRAIYVLSSHAPEISKTIPSKNWIKLK